MRILGIHDGHNASAALLEDGRVTFAVQEERLNREKNFHGFPERAVRDVLARSGLGPDAIDRVAVASEHYPSPRSRDGLLTHYRHSASLSAQAKEVLRATPAKRLHRSRRREERLGDLERNGFDSAKAVFVEHHLCHAAAATWGSSWRGEDVLVLTCDGGGDELCATVNVAHADGRLERIAAVDDSHSLGRLYATLTFMLGMVPGEHEYKLMGLAPYAPAKGAREAYAALKGLFTFRPDGLAWARGPGVPHLFHALEYLQKLLAYHRFDAIAAGLQLLTEELLTHWVRSAIAATGLRKVALGGGVFMNVKANKAILDLPDVESLYVFPSCGDETNSIGAAFQVYADDARRHGALPAIPPLGAIYWGGEFSPDEEKAAIDAFLFSQAVEVRRPADVAGAVADLLAQGEVVARCSGRMEFGARALGNRSILANPARWEAVRTINEMIKQRDFWMPFAPSILGERSGDYLAKPKDVAAPYMILCFDTVPERSAALSAAVHPYDGTARPQEVYADWNPGYHAVLSAFHARTGEAVILNTSFNLHGFPIVYRPEEALDVFDRSGLRHLCLGPYLVSKP